MFKVWTNVDKNRLYIQIEGYFEDDEIVSSGQEIIRAAQTLKPGFSIVNDISKYHASGQSGASIIKKFQVELVKLGAKEVVRIVEQAVGSMQFSRTGREAGYSAVTASSIEEADALLDEKTQAQTG